MLYKLKVTNTGDIEVTRKNDISKIALTLKKRKLETWYKEKGHKVLYSKKNISLNKAIDYMKQEEPKCL